MRTKKPLSSIVLLMVVLSLLSALGANTIGVSAVESPVIAVVPDSTSGVPGDKVTVSIYTNYTGSHPWLDYITGYQFALSYNPSVLQIGVDGLNRTDTWTGTGTFPPKFETVGKLIVPDSDTVYVNETLMTKPANYTIDYQTGVISFAFTPGTGADIRATYLYALINGDLIVGEPPELHPKFIEGPYDNVAGELSLTWGYYDEAGEVTQGPGTLANVTFTVVGYGASTITIDSLTKLKGWNAFIPPYSYDIIDAAEQPDQIQHGHFQNVDVTHDIAVTSVTPASTTVLAGTSVDIMVNVTNQGNINEGFNVTAYADATPFETQNVINLGSGLTTTLTFTWDTTGLPLGTYAINATASTVPGEMDETNNSLEIDVTVIEPVWDPVAVITAEETCAFVNGTLAFSGVNSYDPDGGTIIAYEWDFDDGDTATGLSITHKFEIIGLYTVTLVVTDNQNQVSDPTEIPVTIEDYPPEPPAYSAALVKWKAKAEARNWYNSTDPDGLLTITALATNFGTNDVNVTITFDIYYAHGGEYVNTFSNDTTLEVSGGDVPVTVDIPPESCGFTGTKVILDADVTLEYYDADADVWELASTKTIHFAIWP